MLTDVVKLDIQIKGEELAFDEVTEVIISELEAVISQLQRANGNIQNYIADDDTASIRYMHLKTTNVN